MTAIEADIDTQGLIDEKVYSPRLTDYCHSPGQFRSNIPDELKHISRWLACKILPVPGKPKLRKLPCTLNSYDTKRKKTGEQVSLMVGDVADPLDERSWSNFEAALQTLEQGQHQMLGFVLTEHDEFTVIDMDDVLEVGDLGQPIFHVPEAEAIYEAALQVNAYIQLSASKTGLHIFVTGPCCPKETIQLPDGGGQIEIFTTARFIAMTADQLGELPGSVVDGKNILEVVRSSGKQKGQRVDDFGASDFLLGDVPEHLKGLVCHDDSIWSSGLHTSPTDLTVTAEIVSHVVSCMADLTDEQVGAESFYKNLTRCIAELRNICFSDDLREQLLAAWDDRCKRATGYDEAGNLADLERFDREAAAGSNRVGPFWLSRQVGREDEFYALLSEGVPAEDYPPTAVLKIAAKPDFPVGALGPILGKAVAAIADIVQAPAGMAANAVLAHAAFVVQPLCNIGLDGRVMPVSLFLTTVAESGDRKSACDNVAGSAVLGYQQQLVYDQGDRVQEYRNERALVEQARKRALSKKGSEEEQRLSLEALPEPEAPPDAHFIVQEPTLEGLQKSFKHGLPSQLLNNDEGAQFFGGHAMNPENRAKTIAGLSKFWDGSPISRTRAAVGESVMMFNRRLSIHLQMQPVIANSVLEDPLLMQQGILARFLIADCDSLAGTRLYNGQDASRHPAVKKFHMLSLKLLAYRPEVDSGGGLVLPLKGLSVEAKSFWVEEYNRTERELGVAGEYEIIKPFAAKAAENALRLAAVLSVYETDDAVSKRAVADVSLDQMQRAWQITHYYIQGILRRTQLGETNEAGRQAMEVLEWLRGRGDRATIAEMQRQLPRRQHRKSVGHIRSLMEVLVKSGVVQVVDSNTRGDPCEWVVVHH